MWATGEDRMRAIEQAEEWVSIKLTWKPARYVGPLGGTVTRNRLNEYWYHHNDHRTIRDLGEDASADHYEIHANVQTLGQRDIYDGDTKTKCRFESDIINTLIRNKFEEVENTSDWHDYATYESTYNSKLPYNTPWTGIYTWIADHRNGKNAWEERYHGGAAKLHNIPAATLVTWPRWRDVNGTNKLWDETHIWQTGTDQTPDVISGDNVRSEITTPNLADWDSRDYNSPAVAPRDKELYNFPSGINLVFDITTPKDNAVENYHKWGKSIDEEYGQTAQQLEVLWKDIYGAHPMSKYEIKVGDRGNALYAKGNRGKLDDPWDYDVMTEWVKICELVVKRDIDDENKITNAWLNWENNYVADDILNYARHNQLNDRETFTTRLVQRVDLCAPHNITEDVVYYKDGWYDKRELVDNAGNPTTAYVDGSAYFRTPGTWQAGKSGDGQQIDNRWTTGNNVAYHAYVQRYDHSFYLKKSHFRVKFLRPINLDTLHLTFYDAAERQTNLAQGDRQYLHWRLTDWREKDFLTAGDYHDGIANDGRDYFRYYGALDGVNGGTPNYGTAPTNKATGDMLPEHIKIFTQSKYITTDMHGGVFVDDKLCDRNNPNKETKLYTKISSTMNDGTAHPDLFKYVGPDITAGEKWGWDKNDLGKSNVEDYVDRFGYIYYDNNRVNVGTFRVKIPVRLQYRWGYLWTFIIADVNPTIANPGE